MYQEKINFFFSHFTGAEMCYELSFFVMLLALHIHSRSTLAYVISLIFHFFTNLNIVGTGYITHQWWNKVVGLKWI